MLSEMLKRRSCEAKICKNGMLLLYHVYHLYHVFIWYWHDKGRWPSASSSCMNWSTERQLCRPPQSTHCQPINQNRNKEGKPLKNVAPSQVQPSQCPSERSKALDSNSSLVLQTNHQRSVAWIDRWVPLCHQKYVTVWWWDWNPSRLLRKCSPSCSTFKNISSAHMHFYALDKSFTASPSVS